MLNELEAELQSRIRTKGPITFAEFSELALYWPRGGYYTTQRPIGAEGDFFTAPSIHPLFGELLATQLRQMWTLMDSPSHFRVMELGAGDGTLAQDIIAFSKRLNDKFFQSLDYLAVDFQTPQIELPKEICWAQVESIPEKDFSGCILANELLDAMPVHRVTMREGRLYELYVDLNQSGQLVEIEAEPSTLDLARRFQNLGIELSNGYRTEVNLALDQWVEKVANTLDYGYILLIDYGHDALSLYNQLRDRGTLRCYYRHTLNANPYQHLGRQDISVHVDFTSLIQLARTHGLHLLGYTTQAEFLNNLGFKYYRDAISSDEKIKSAEKRQNLNAVDSLVRADGMGDFKALLLGKGVPEMLLDGFNPENSGMQSLSDDSTKLRPSLLTKEHKWAHSRVEGESYEFDTWDNIFGS